MKRKQFMDDDDYPEGAIWNMNNLYSDPEEPLDLNIPASSKPESNAGSERKPQASNKNKYIKKIGELKPNQTAATHKIQPNLSELDLPAEQLKRRKNRQAARGSRQRKKEYIRLIEEQTKILEQAIANTERQIETFKIEIQRSVFNNNQSIGVVDSKLAQIHKKLERILATEDGQEKDIELNLALDSLVYRFGVSGRQRKHNINQGYRLTISIILPILTRYFMWAAKQKAQIFKVPGSTEHESWFSEVRTILEPNIKDNQEYLLNKRARFEQIQSIYTESVFKLKKTKAQIEKVVESFEEQFIEIRESLTPSQCAKLIFFIEKFKYRAQLRMIDQGKQQVFQFAAFGPRKQIKTEQQMEE